MIAIIATCDCQRIRLIRHFVDHYQRQGIDHFHLSLHVPPEEPGPSARGHIAHAERELALLGLGLEAVLREPFDAFVIRNHHDAIQARVAPRYDALIWADIDELHELPQPLAGFVGAMRRDGVTALRGRFVDRVSRSGELVPFTDTQSIWAQFPIGTNLTAKILRGSVEKLVLAAPDVFITPGNHGPTAGQTVKWYPGTVAVHHFKWDQTVLTRLQERLTDSWKARCYWWTQSETAKSWLHSAGSRICFDDLEIYDFQDDQTFNAGPYGANTRYLGGLYW